MRQIKFRIWNKKGKRMLYDSSLAFRGNKVIEEIGTKVMQFTELYDKKNREIYDGDIIKDLNGFIWGVSWGNGEWTNLVAMGEAMRMAEWIDKGNKLREYEPDECKWHDCKVIGNIYENPERINNG